MAQFDWFNITSSLVSPDIERGATPAVTPPNGGGTFTYGLNSTVDVLGASGLYINLANFIPASDNGQITGAVQRGIQGNTTGAAPGLFMGLTGTTITDTGYILGLSDAEPARIILRKGRLIDGIPDQTPDPTVNGNLMASSDTFAQGEWLHLRLDAITQGTGDVLLKCWINDLGTDPVTAPVWTIIPGMDGPLPTITGFIDDALQVNTGTAPLTSGYVGFSSTLEGLGRRAYFDHITAAYQV
jgi:hypothetical protein